MKQRFTDVCGWQLKNAGLWYCNLLKTCYTAFTNCEYSPASAGYQAMYMSILEMFHCKLKEFMKSNGGQVPTKVRISRLTAIEFEKLGYSEIGELATDFLKKGAENVFNEENFRFRGLKVIVENCTKEDIEADNNGNYRFDFEI